MKEKRAQEKIQSDLPIFFCKNPEKISLLDREESAHAIRVLRLRNGDLIKVIDGLGGEYVATIMSDDPFSCSFQIISKQKHLKTKENFTLAIAPPKSRNRLEFLIEKSVELGVDKILFLECERSERRSLNIDRLEKIVIAACKQSKHVWMPSLEENLEFMSFIKREQEKEDIQKFIAYCSDKFPRQDYSSLLKSGLDTIVCIGPEGDFTSNEVKVAVDNNFVPITLGHSRLRTETAALYAISGFKFINHN